MAFVRLAENLTVNTQYIVKVKWKVANDGDDELSASVFLTSAEKANEVVTARGEAAYKLWDALHVKEEPPRSPHSDKRDSLPQPLSRRLRQQW
jgi:hypothetical protein